MTTNRRRALTLAGIALVAWLLPSVLGVLTMGDDGGPEDDCLECKWRRHGG